MSARDRMCEALRLNNDLDAREGSVDVVYTAGRPTGVAYRGRTADTLRTIPNECR